MPGIYVSCISNQIPWRVVMNARAMISSVVLFSPSVSRCLLLGMVAGVTADALLESRQCAANGVARRLKSCAVSTGMDEVEAPGLAFSRFMRG